MATLLESIQNKYAEEETGQDEYGWIVFVSNSPECKKGMFPPIMTLSDYDINRLVYRTFLEFCCNIDVVTAKVLATVRNNV